MYASGKCLVTWRGIMLPACHGLWLGVYGFCHLAHCWPSDIYTDFFLLQFSHVSVVNCHRVAWKWSFWLCWNFHVCPTRPAVNCSACTSGLFTWFWKLLSALLSLPDDRRWPAPPAGLSCTSTAPCSGWTRCWHKWAPRAFAAPASPREGLEWLCEYRKMMSQSVRNLLPLPTSCW